MENEVKKKSEVASSILAKFQQFSKEKEEAASNKRLGTKEKYSGQNKRKHPDDEALHNGIPEEDVGITKYVSSHDGFTGILKHRFTDFQVHEIDSDGKLVELTSTSIPEVVLEDNLLEVDKSIISEDLWTKIEEILKSEDDEQVAEIDVTQKDKKERTLIHKTLKSVYGPRIFSNTVSKEDVTVIKVGKSTKKDRVCWPKNLPEFLHFTLVKLKMDTTHCVCLLSKKLRLKANYFTYAGTKDRRAITTQKMCVKRKRAEELAQLSIRGIKIGNYEYKSKSLRLGELSGNKFTITIRNIEAENNVIEAAMDSLNKNGFINYFGLQRFGSSASVPTFAVGKAILMRDWKLAVELILKPRSDEKCQPWIRQARETWWETRDPGKSLRFLSRNQHSLEFRVLKALKQNPTDYHGALLSIPRNTLMLYLHSYQSLVWNQIVSRRIEKFKFEPQIGDLVVVNTEETNDEVVNEVEKDEVIESDEDDNQVPDKIEEVKKRPAVQALTEGNVSSVSIFDIVYPLPGHDVEYPQNEIGKWYKEILQKDGINEEDLKSNNKMFSLYGTYRKALDKVGNLEWKIVEHSDFDEDLVLSDFDKVEEKLLKEADISDTKIKSLIMDITLPPSTYATMVLREVMKTDTSVSFHALLTRNVQEAKRLKISMESSKEDDHPNGEA
ncbi:pseudouridylate synthase 7 homolog isoform X2 [Halyomorpha halys]|nr:pseudouridylate synthase 7 homolog isoform X2 [Halyomorpha halys]XP_014273563.1 pseudouridylate synthase 7 homolog isoform X2 [Halyomorpha halys]XP_014273564.1 pseudouridylate synthase 7 homolog isoform X2 [Halyomorpha halys]